MGVWVYIFNLSCLTDRGHGLYGTDSVLRRELYHVTVSQRLLLPPGSHCQFRCLSCVSSEPSPWRPLWSPSLWCSSVSLWLLWSDFLLFILGRIPCASCRSRFVSCSSSGRISVTALLNFAPTLCLNYTILQAC